MKIRKRDGTMREVDDDYMLQDGEALVVPMRFMDARRGMIHDGNGGPVGQRPGFLINDDERAAQAVAAAYARIRRSSLQPLASRTGATVKPSGIRRRRTVPNRSGPSPARKMRSLMLIGNMTPTSPNGGKATGGRISRRTRRHPHRSPRRRRTTARKPHATAGLCANMTRFSPTVGDANGDRLRSPPARAGEDRGPIGEYRRDCAKRP